MFGFGASGSGRAWFSDMRFERVSKNVVTTQPPSRLSGRIRTLPAEPANLDLKASEAKSARTVGNEKWLPHMDSNHGPAD